MAFDCQEIKGLLTYLLTYLLTLYNARNRSSCCLMTTTTIAVVQNIGGQLFHILRYRVV